MLVGSRYIALACSPSAYDFSVFLRSSSDMFIILIILRVESRERVGPGRVFFRAPFPSYSLGVTRKWAPQELAVVAVENSTSRGVDYANEEGQ